ncbi:MAG: class I tRNA ligase family protein, partial [Calditrichaeota bacterium]|nr:class I tRNA ligase family protein [Calditrichota bacterium]
MFNLIPNQINYDEIEADLIRDWKANDIFKKSIKSGRTFVFYEGPPTANGKPGIHHVMARTIKDIITRYKSLQGFKVERKAGWDTHGLPVEIEVEKQLKIEGRDQILQYGLGEFNEACRRSVFTYKDLWDEMTERMGYWVDLSDPYITCENDYIESVWWILSELFKKDLIYKGYKIQPYCPKCGTALSSHEVSQGYKDVKDLTATVRFQLKDEENTYLLAWTTTPWTLPSNVALAVGKDIDYIKVRHVDEKNGPEFLILAKALADSLLSDEYEIESTFKGSELVGRRYHPLFDFVETNENSHQVLSGDFVTTEDGTGIVHMEPDYGDDDYKTCLANDIPVDIIVNTDGTFSDKAGEFAGYYIKDADPEIVTNLKHRGLLFKSQKLEHS